MADTRTPEQRRRIMQAVRSRDTKPELTVRHALWAAGLRYRLCVKTLPGRPDVVFSSKKIAVFVHGCFWHGHPGCPRHRIPKTRSEFWEAKIARNKARDAEAAAALADMGWTVMVLWGCEVEDPAKVDALVRTVQAAPRTARV